jgi:hypothetical protein
MSLRLGAPDRRRMSRGSPRGGPRRADVIDRVLGAFREDPGLCLCAEDAARLIGLEAETCRAVLEDLVRARRLRRTAGGQYVSQPPSASPHR